MPAEKIGLKTGDKFLSFDGVYVLNQEHLSEVINKGQGRPCEVVIERDGQRLNFTVTPVFDAEAKRGRIGVGFAGGHYEVQRPGPNPIEQFSDVLRLMGKTFTALFYSKETGVTAKDMSGPVGILGKLALDVKTDYRLALSFMVMLNINLALLNLLPLPVLDGGHILMALYELATRRRVGVRFQEVVTTGFAVLLISFMLYVTFYDIRRVPLFGQLLKQKSVIEQPVQSSPAPPPVPR
jgi:regulator of sigma E protease